MLCDTAPMSLSIDDRDAIEQLAIEYAHAVDERDWARFEALFAPDAAIDYVDAGGIAGTPAEIAAWLPDALSMFTWTMHSISTHRIVADGPDSATGAVHVLARHGLVWDGEDEHMDTLGIYRDRYVRTADGWRFSARREDVMQIAGGKFAALLRDGSGR